MQWCSSQGSVAVAGRSKQKDYRSSTIASREDDNDNQQQQHSADIKMALAKRVWYSWLQLSIFSSAYTQRRNKQTAFSSCHRCKNYRPATAAHQKVVILLLRMTVVDY
jgi:hypothetical protein